MNDKVYVKIAGCTEKSFIEASDLLDKYITNDFKETSYKKTELGKIKLATKEIAIYTNGNKTYQIMTLWNKSNNLYNLRIEELKDNREIKVYTNDGDSFYTHINGSEEDIINHYNDNNFLGNQDKQVVKVEIIGFGKEIVGCLESIKEFIFNYNNKAQCYLY